MTIHSHMYQCPGIYLPSREQNKLKTTVMKELFFGPLYSYIYDDYMT